MRIRHPLRFALLATFMLAPFFMKNTSAGTLDVLRNSNEQLRRVVLDNGMVCLIKPDASAPVVAVQIWVGSGSINEGRWLGAGLSHYMEHMIFKGTPTRGPAEITKAIDNAGGEINAYTSQDRTVFFADLPSHHWKVGVDVLADAIMHATLPEDEWEREKEVILREFAMGEDSPERQISKLLFSTAYRVHPYRFPVIGYEDVFRTMTRDQLEAYFHEHYVPDNMITVVVGDINPDEVETYLRDTFAPFKRRAHAQEPLPTEPTQVAPREARKTTAVEMSRMVMAWHTVSLDHPDVPALDLLAALAGGGRSSRLELRLKERNQLVNSTDAWSFTPRDGGLFAISASFDPEKEAAVRAAIDDELAQWAEHGFTDAEIEKVRRNQLVSELEGLRTMHGQAANYASGEFYTGNPRASEIYLDDLSHVTSEQIQAVIKRYLNPKQRTLVVLAPPTTNEQPAAVAGQTNALNISRFTLDNGIPVIVREDHRLPLVYVSAVLGGGLLAENADNNGITDLMASLLSRGTSKHSAEEIALEVEQHGASLDYFSGRNSFGLSATMLTEDTDHIFSLFAECLLDPTFDNAELEKQKALQLMGIRQRSEQPMTVANDALRALLFPGHPYQFNTEGTLESVRRLTADDARSHYQQLMTRSNLVLAIFGDITPEDAKALAEKYFAGVPVGQKPSLARVAPAPALPAEKDLVEPREQAIVLVGYPGISIFDPRADALQLLQAALSGLSSDLGIEIREKRGLVYYVGATSVTALDPGLFAIYAGTREEAIPEVERLVDAELERIKRDGIRTDEFERVRAQFITSISMDMQNNGGLALKCALHELYGLGYRYPLELEQRLMALTPEDVRTAADELLLKEKRATVVVHPASAQKESNHE